MRILTNLPTPGGDDGTWGDELNAALLEFDAAAARVDEVYDKTAADARFVRTVNGVAPVNGDVLVSGGGGGTGTVTKVNGVLPDPTGNVPLAYSNLLNKPVIPTQAADVNAIALSQKGAASGVASLDTNTQVPIGQLPVGSGSTQVAAGTHTHAVPISWLPAGSTITVTDDGSGVYPARPTTRTDIIVVWRGSNPPLSGGTGAVANVDEWRTR